MEQYKLEDYGAMGKLLELEDKLEILLLKNKAKAEAGETKKSEGGENEDKH